MKESELVAMIAARFLAGDVPPIALTGKMFTESQVRAAVSSAYDVLTIARVESRQRHEARAAREAAAAERHAPASYRLEA
jgi:hypothetical protein